MKVRELLQSWEALEMLGRKRLPPEAAVAIARLLMQTDEILSAIDAELKQVVAQYDGTPEKEEKVAEIMERNVPLEYQRIAVEELQCSLPPRVLVQLSWLLDFGR